MILEQESFWSVSGSFWFYFSLFILLHFIFVFLKNVNKQFTQVTTNEQVYGIECIFVFVVVCRRIKGCKTPC